MSNIEYVKSLFPFLILPVIQVLCEVQHLQIRVPGSIRRETRECLRPDGGQHFETDPGNAFFLKPLRYRFIICIIWISTGNFNIYLT